MTVTTPSRSPARTLVALGAALALMAMAPPGTAADDCEQSLASCSTDHDETYTAPASIQQLSAVLQIRRDNEGLSQEVYEALVPDQYDVPAVPLVAVSMTRFDVPRTELGDAGVPLTGIVTSLALRVDHDEEQGWYPISQGTTSTDAYDFGRSVGWPTHLAEASLTAEGEQVTGTSAVEGADSMTMTWTSASPTVGTDNLAWASREQPFFSLRTPLEGPDRSRVKVTHKPAVPVFDVTGGPPLGQLEVDDVTAHAAPSKGTVQVTLDADLDRLDAATPDPLPALPFPPDTSLADLVELDQQAPGLLWETDTELIVQADNLDDGQDGPLPDVLPEDLPAIQSAAVAGPGAVTTGYATPVLAVTTGSTVEFANLDTVDHNVTAFESGPDGRRLFRSATISLGETATVEGVGELTAGQYGFYCTLHPGMTGELIVR